MCCGLTWRKHSVDFAGFVENFPRVILQRGALVEMYGDWELARVHLDDGRGHAEQLLVLCEVLHTQRGRHDEQLHWHSFLRRHGDVGPRASFAMNGGRQNLRWFPRYLVSEWDDPRQQPDEDVRVHAPFMSLVNDYHAVSLEQEVLELKNRKFYAFSFLPASHISICI